MIIKDKKIFLTGGAGFIGTSLIEHLVDNNKIIIYDNLHRNAIKGTSLLGNKNVSLVQEDVLNLKSLQQAMQDSNIVIHLAAIAGVDAVLKSPVRTMKTNVIGTHNVLEAAQTLPTLERLVNFSTSEVFGTHAYKVEETHVTPEVSVGEARWTYAIGKLAGEYFAHSYFHEHGMPVTILRPFNVYGPKQVGEGAIHHFVIRAIKNQDLVIHGDGSQIRAWCYIDDMVSGILLCLTKKEAVSNAFNIGNPQGIITVRSLAEKIVKLANSKSQIVHVPKSYTDVELRIPSIEKAVKLLGYQPKVDLDKGLKRTIDWYQERTK